MRREARTVLYCESCRSSFMMPRGYDGTCPACGEFIRRFRCYRCGHMWVPREWMRLPKVCPSCKSPYWCKERMNREGEE